MSGNKFENQVQQKMDGLRLQPTARVWDEVERRIREKKRRRIVVFWIFFTGLLLSGGVWWMMDQQGKNKTAIATISEKKNENKNDNNDEILKTDQPNNTNEPVKNDKNENRNTQSKINEQSSETNQLVIKEKPGRKKRIFVKGTIPGLPLKTKETNDNITFKTNATDKVKEKKDMGTDVPGIVKGVKENIKSQDDPTAQPVIKPGDVQDLAEVKNKQELKKEVDSLPVNNNQQPAVSKKNKHQSKWETGLFFSAGNTRLTNGMLNSFGQKSMDVYASPSTGTGGTYSQINYADSIPLKGTALQSGISARRKLGKKTAFSVGLGLSYYSTKQRTGSFNDSLIVVNNNLRTLTSAGYYRAGNNNVYHNKYYYLQAPLLFYWQMNKGKKLPLEWENGVAPSVLLESNAVVYDRSTRIFYKDKRVFNSFSLVYQTAFTARLFKEEKHPLTLGIFYNYHLGRLQKIAPPDYNYLSSYGIKLNWVLKK